MKKYLVLVAIALSVGFTACEDEDDVKNVVSIISESGDNSVAQLDTLYLSVKVENGISDANYAWTVNGQVRGEKRCVSKFGRSENI